MHNVCIFTLYWITCKNYERKHIDWLANVPWKVCNFAQNVMPVGPVVGLCGIYRHFGKFSTQCGGIYRRNRFIHQVAFNKIMASALSYKRIQTNGIQIFVHSHYLLALHAKKISFTVLTCDKCLNVQLSCYELSLCELTFYEELIGNV